MTLEPIIGLEIHIQLKTKSKMFCACQAHEVATPNTNICPVCMGHPGTLPVVNAEAVRFGIRMGLALECKIADRSKFDRKNYFYPDLPKAYQISQYDMPIAEKGSMKIEVPNNPRSPITIGITRAHLEEDAAKNIHDKDGKTYVDFNRGGTPLIEIVTEPDFRSPEEAKTFLQELRLIARYLGISDADMEKGHLRCDANISLRPIDEDNNVISPKLHPKTEIKNINSFRHVERALSYEIQRQTKLWNAGTPPAVSTTRGWNDVKQVTEEQRTKEAAEDYRYFPEPDLPALDLRELTEQSKNELPELPAQKRLRFVKEYALKSGDARQICDDLALANFTEHVFSELHAWLDSLPELDRAQEEIWTKECGRVGKLVAGWLLSKLGGILAEHKSDIRIMHISPENFAEFITLLATNRLSTTNGMKVLEEMFLTGADPSHIMEEKQLGKMDDTSTLADAIDQVIAQNPIEAERYRAGDKKLIAFFIGQVMKTTEGAADAKETKNLLAVKLENIGR